MAKKRITLMVEEKLLKVLDETAELWNEVHRDGPKTTRSELLRRGGIVAVLKLNIELRKELIEKNVKV